MERNIRDLTDLIDDPLLAGVVTLITPYVPALKKLGSYELHIVMENMLANKWRRVDETCIPLLTREQRMKLISESYDLSYAAALDAWQHKKLLYETAIKVGVALLIGLL